jgi:hypothetical protein
MLHHEMPAFIRNFMGCTCGGVFLPISSHQDFDMKIGRGRSVSFEKCCPESTNTLFVIVQDCMKRHRHLPPKSFEHNLVMSRFRDYFKHQKLLMFLMRDEATMGELMILDASRSHQVGGIDSACSTYNRVRRMAEQSGSYNLEYQSLKGLGEIALGAGDPMEALYLFDAAFKVIDFIRQEHSPNFQRAEVAMLMCEAVRVDIRSRHIAFPTMEPPTSIIDKLRTSAQLWTQHGHHGSMDTDLFMSFSQNIMGLYHEHERGGPKNCVYDYTKALQVSVAGERKELQGNIPTANTLVIRVYEKASFWLPGYLPQAVEMELWHAVQGLRRKLSVDEFKRVLDAERVEFVPM